MQPRTRVSSYEHSGPETHILIVDDNVVLGRTLASTIKRFGGQGTAVGTVRDALSQLASFDVWAGVILDLCLPDGLGIRVLESLREGDQRCRDLPVLVHTGHPDHPSISAAYNLRAQFLEKPSTAGQIEQFFRFSQQFAANRQRLEPTAAAATPDDPCADPLSRVVAAILRERRTTASEALRSFWRIGELINRFRRDASPHCLRATLAECAANLRVHPSWLDDSARAASVLSREDKGILYEACKDGRAHLTPSHVAELARAHPTSRRGGIAALLTADISVVKLRERLRH